jgi:hypothetical protein
MPTGVALPVQQSATVLRGPMTGSVTSAGFAMLPQ